MFAVGGGGVLPRIGPRPRKALRSALQKLRDDPTDETHNLDIKHLDGGHAKGLLRLRVGRQRVIFAVQEDVIRVTSIMDRSSGYEWLRDL